MKFQFSSILNRNTNSAVIVETDGVIIRETLVRGQGEVDETWDEFIIRVSNRLDYLNGCS